MQECGCVAGKGFSVPRGGMLRLILPERGALSANAGLLLISMLQSSQLRRSKLDG
jgi:hypothetical protein